MTETKKLSYKQLQKGMKLRGWRTYAGTTITRFGAYGPIESISPIEIKFEGSNETLNPQEIDYYEVDLTKEELISKWRPAAAHALERLKVELAGHEIGEHEMWNAWIGCDLYELARNLHEYKLTLLGHCRDVPWQKVDWLGDTLACGICVEDEEGVRFWCHVTDGHLDDLLEGDLNHAYCF